MGRSVYREYLFSRVPEVPSVADPWRSSKGKRSAAGPWCSSRGNRVIEDPWRGSKGSWMRKGASCFGRAPGNRIGAQLELSLNALDALVGNILQGS